MSNKKIDNDAKSKYLERVRELWMNQPELQGKIDEQALIMKKILIDWRRQEDAIILQDNLERKKKEDRARDNDDANNSFYYTAANGETRSHLVDLREAIDRATTGEGNSYINHLASYMVIVNLCYTAAHVRQADGERIRNRWIWPYLGEISQKVKTWVGSGKTVEAGKLDYSMSLDENGYLKLDVDIERSAGSATGIVKVDERLHNATQSMVGLWLQTVGCELVTGNGQPRVMNSKTGEILTDEEFQNLKNDEELGFGCFLNAVVEIEYRNVPLKYRDPEADQPEEEDDELAGTPRPGGGRP